MPISELCLSDSCFALNFTSSAVSKDKCSTAFVFACRNATPRVNIGGFMVAGARETKACSVISEFIFCQCDRQRRLRSMMGAGRKQRN